MLTLHDLMNNPESLNPLGSRKGVLNKPTSLNTSMTNMFLDPGNTAKLHKNLYNTYRQTEGETNVQKFRDLVFLLQKKFVKENQLEFYITAESDAVGFNNYLVALKAINTDFTRMVYTYFKWNTMVTYPDIIEVGPHDDRVIKESKNIRPEDYLTLDLWHEQFTQSLNRNFRNNNKIPVYRTGIHTRNYDRGNEGLVFTDPDRASLETPIYGYDMGNITKVLDNYKSEEWYGV